MSRLLTPQPSMADQLLPCASGSTLVAHTITVLLPDLVSRTYIEAADIENFVFAHTHRAVTPTVTHLLVYLFACHAALGVPEVPDLSHLRLLHAGKMYTIPRRSDLLARLPWLAVACRTLATFQLVVTPPPPYIVLPLPKTPDALLGQTLLAPDQDLVYAVTYLDAMVRFVKHRLSLLSCDSRLTLSLSTDVEEDKQRAARNRLKRFFTRRRRMPRPQIAT